MGIGLLAPAHHLCKQPLKTAEKHL